MAREIYSRNWDRMTFEEQREYRDRKLSWFVRTNLYPYSPFYRKMLDDAKVAPEDIGKVIGKQGRTARSIRTLLLAVGTKLNRRFSLEIVE